MLNPVGRSHVSRDVVCDGRRAGQRGTAVLAAICIFAAILAAPQVIFAQEAPPVTPAEPPASGEPQDPAEPPADPTTPDEPPAPTDPTTPEEPAPPTEPTPGEEPPAPATTPGSDTKQETQAKAVFVARKQGGTTVTMEDFLFSPATVSISVGDSVTWTNSGQEPHNAVADDGSFETAILESGDSETVTFDEAGSFAYICSIHPDMKGTVEVSDDSEASKSDDSDTSEEDAVSSPTAAGTDTSLPSTGSDAVPLAVVGLLLVALGGVARMRTRAG